MAAGNARLARPTARVERSSSVGSKDETQRHDPDLAKALRRVGDSVGRTAAEPGCSTLGCRRLQTWTGP